MKYLKLYREFKEYNSDVALKDSEIEDDLIDNDFIDKQIEDKGSYKDAKGVIHVKNWKKY